MRSVGLFWTCLTLAVVFWTSAARGEPSAAADLGQSIVVGGDHGYPPYEYLDDNGMPAGYNVDLTRAIAEVMGIQVEIRLGRWSEIREALVAGKIDVLQGMVFSEGRSRWFDFSPPHTYIHQSIFIRRGTQAIETLDALNGRQVIVQNNGIMHDFLLSKGIRADLVLTDTHADALRMLSSGRCDCALVANLPGLYLGRELKLTNIVSVSKPVAGMPYCYVVRKGNRNLLALFSEGLAILKNTGRHAQIYDQWLGGLEPRGIPWTRVIKIGLLTISPLLLLIGAITAWNRTLQKRVAQRTEELRRHQEQLMQTDKLASLGILVSGVAHEINNPNGLILLNVPMLKEILEDCRAILEAHHRRAGDFTLGGLDYMRVREQIAPMCAETLEAARKIKRIVEDLKDFARQGDSGMRTHQDLNGIVRAALRLVENQLKKATHRVHVSLADNLPSITANAQRIEQVAVNLILNACQALPGSECAIAVGTRCLPGRKRVILEVRDQGCGIAPEHLRHLTDPFFTTKRESGGTGLGLWVSANIVREHGGELVFTSTYGNGTTAQLILPVDGEK